MNFIAEWRQFRGFKTQGDLAKAANMTRPTVSRLESGALPYNQRQLTKLATALKCKEGDLILIDPNMFHPVLWIFYTIPPKDRARALDLLSTFATRVR